ncbi:MAG: signal transduction histidine kinase/ligand-binding sensor domain-containing protein [Paraglaciecola sp.]|jgi:signal transduction histidine kinase/ligand-binding sensor domain-containing protein/CheY-like chemotaxis protein/HPt (histidine-containing phosphotransfer) domain-containing protein
MFSVAASEYKFELLNENDGFASSIIFSIVQDRSGFLWFGTGYNGIMRYDGKNVVRYEHDLAEQNSLPNNNAGNITLDRDNNLWIGSWGGGVLKYNQQNQQFSQFKHVLTQSNTVGSPKVQNIFEDQQGEIWLGAVDGGLNKFNPESQDFTRFPLNDPIKNSISDNRIWDIEQSSAENLWVGTSFGLNLFNKTSSKFTHFIPTPDRVAADHNRIRHIIVAKDNTLFLGTQDGVLLFESQKSTFTALEVEGHLSLGPIYSMIETDFNQYWVSSDIGVFSFSEDDLTLRKVQLDFDDRCSQTLFQDRQGIIWLSCEGVGVYKITRANIFKTYGNQKMKAAYSLLVANDDGILIGTAQHGIQRWYPATNQLTALEQKSENTIQSEVRYMTQTSQGDIWHANKRNLFKLDKAGVKQQISPSLTTEHRELFKDINDISVDEQDNIWVATRTGLFIIRDVDADFEYIPVDKEDPKSLIDISILELYLDPDNRMWIGTNKGLKLWNKQTKKLQAFSYAGNNNKSVEGHDYIYTIFLDSKQRLWVGTKTGLQLLNEKTAEYNVYTSYFSEIDNLGVRFISEDEKGNLWLITPVGVSKLNPNNGELQHFDKRDGLPGSRYFYNPTANTSDGTIYLSSRDGIYYFDPSSVTNHSLNEETRLTNFEILGASKNYNIATAEMSGISLNYDESNVKFEFATLDFLNARQIQYSYKLDGFDTEWIENGNNSTATYTNLGGGDYTFRVRAAVKKNLLYNKELAVDLHIDTPFWLRWWMFVFYGCLVLLGIYHYLQRQKKSVIKLERQVAEKTAAIALESSKLASANKIKTLFLANMSHEIRTPLTTVIGQAEAIICRDVDPKNIYNEVEIIHDSSLYLLALLNDILDLTKIEENKFELELAPQDLHGLLKNINIMFSFQAKVKGLSFSLVEDLPVPFIVNVDGLRLKQILINLCSNAIKFTVKGHVSLNISAQDDKLLFNIEDTGIGISESQIQLIFASFTQGDSSIRRRFGGSGLGLHLSNQLAALMGGSITVKSELDKGSVFTFSIPVTAISPDTELVQKKSATDVSFPQHLFSGKILLAEDHLYNRRLIARLLTKLGLTVLTASDGFEAIELYCQHSPKAILLDIQMPNMDGMQAYKELRELGCTQPIFALTANAMTNEVEEYLAMGFDGYIKKPLDRQHLIAIVAKHFSSKDGEVEIQADKELGKVDMSDLIVEFKGSLSKELQQFSVNEANENLDEIAKQAHSLCGAAQLFGFAQLSEKAATLETSIKNNSNDLTHIKGVLQSLLDEIKGILAD